MKVRFHLPGLRYNYPLNMMFLSLQKTFPHYFREGVEIASFFGEFPTSLWNGGRFSNGDQCDEKFIRQVIKNINAQGVPVRFTYSNPCITEKDLDDPYCNFCMQVADNGMNEVIVVSPILEEYIRKTYPSFKVNSSTCKEIKDIDTLNAELEKDYYMVVLDQNMNRDFEFINQIKNKEKVEILVNACCAPDCARRTGHYRIIDTQQRVVLENRKLPPEKRKPIPGWYCEAGDKNNLYTIRNNKQFVSPDAIWETYVPMGFQNFKLEGRTANIFSLIDSYTYWMLKPEYRDEGRLCLIYNLEQSHVISVHKPKPGVWP